MFDVQMTDTPEFLHLVSPNIITKDWDGMFFAELEAKFSEPSLRYHCVGLYSLSKDHLGDIVKLAQNQTGKKKPLMRIKTVRKMKVYDLMTGGEEGVRFVNQKSRIDPCEDQDRDRVDGRNPLLLSGTKSFSRSNSVKEKLDRHNDNQLTYENIAMPEVFVNVYFDEQEDVSIDNGKKT